MGACRQERLPSEAMTLIQKDELCVVVVLQVGLGLIPNNRGNRIRLPRPGRVRDAIGGGCTLNRVDMLGYHKPWSRATPSTNSESDGMRPPRDVQAVELCRIPRWVFRLRSLTRTNVAEKCAQDRIAPNGRPTVIWSPVFVLFLLPRLPSLPYPGGLSLDDAGRTAMCEQEVVMVH